MRELYPVATADVDPTDRYRRDDRTPQVEGRPWVMVNMITTVDGATAVEGRSGGLGGPADRIVFRAIRSVADMILVGAGTVRAESYGTPRLSPGQTVPPRLAIVTRSLDIDPSSSVFVDAPAHTPPIVVTTEHSDEARRAQLAPVADLVVAGTDDVDVVRALGLLRGLGAEVVLCEGGPSLNGQLVAADAIDELCVTIAPLVAAGASSRLAHGALPPAPRSMRLDRVLEQDSVMFLRYVRAEEVSAASVPSPS